MIRDALNNSTKVSLFKQVVFCNCPDDPTDDTRVLGSLDVESNKEHYKLVRIGYSQGFLKINVVDHFIRVRLFVCPDFPYLQLQPSRCMLDHFALRWIKIVVLSQAERGPTFPDPRGMQPSILTSLANSGVTGEYQ